VWDTELRGLLVRVRASGRRWFAVEWMRERRTRRLSLGEYGALTVEQARERAKKILGRVAHGEDPAAERAGERAVPPVAELARRYLEEHAGPILWLRTARAARSGIVATCVDSVLHPGGARDGAIIKL
jgi:hypothetical protein